MDKIHIYKGIFDLANANYCTDKAGLTIINSKNPCQNNLEIVNLNN
jgi:hypothetical protein